MLVRCENPDQAVARTGRVTVDEVLTEQPITVNGRISTSGAYLAPGKAGQIDQNNPLIDGTEVLSVREREVLELLCKGYLIKEIASQMEISFDTVRTYIRRIYEKMHVHSRAQAVAKLLQLNHR